MTRSILLVCTANICRSPIAEGVLRKACANMQLPLDIDSAATHSYMLGMPPFPLAVAASKERGCDITRIVSRRVRQYDFKYFDLILAMDRRNLADLRKVAPRRYREKIRLLLEYSVRNRGKSVPDPYGQGASQYEYAFDLIEEACLGLVESLLSQRDAVHGGRHDGADARQRMTP